MPDIIAASRAFVKSPHYIEMTPRQFALIGFLSDEPGPHHVRHLAHAIGVSKPVISRALNRMDDIGLTRRERSSVDGRDKIVTLTQKGAAFRAALAGGSL